MSRGPGIVLIAMAFISGAAAARAGDASTRRRERWAVSAGAALIGGHPLGNRRASFTENRAPSGGRLTYFDASLRLEGAPLWNARLGLRVKGGLWLEGAVSGGRRRLSASLSNDFEGAAPSTANSDLAELQLEGGLRWNVSRLAFFRKRGVPFLFAGAGQLRQSPAEEPSVERTGRTYAGGAGVVYRIVSPARGFWKGAGLRLDGGLSWRTGGFEMEDRRRSAGRISVSLYSAH